MYYKVTLDVLHFGHLPYGYYNHIVVEVFPIRNLPADYPISIIFNVHT
nr:MAG TPA: hypothetical protein [Caudoviricetes sp.]